MLKQVLKYVLVVVAVAIVGYNSVYIKKLDEVRASKPGQFDAAAFARRYLNEKLLGSIKQMPQADTLLSIIKNHPDEAFKNYAHALDIGNVKYFLIRGGGRVTSIGENDVYVVTAGGQTIQIATEYVFGNALRDAPGLININDFSNTMDMNNISGELNKIIRTSVLPPFKARVKTNDHVMFAGALELNREHINLNNIEVIPFSLQIVK